MRLSPVLMTVAAAGCLTACPQPKLIEASCRADDQCPSGTLCENYQCIAKESKACENVLAGTPILQPTPHTVDFGTVDSQAALLQTVSLLNIGNCTLTLFEVSLKDQGAGFTCDLCGSAFPKEVWPGRSIDITLSYAPGAVKNSLTELVMLSDDKEYPELRVPVRANYIGTPQLLASPNPVEFGYTAQGRLSRRTVGISNQGTGSAPLVITSVALSPADTMDFALVAPTNLPRTLRPASTDRTAVETIEVRYTPRSLADHAADLVITSDKGTLIVPLSGTSASSPAVAVSPADVDLGDVRVGSSNFKTVTILNQGGAPLTVRPTWGGTMFTTDFSTNPQLVPNVAPSQYVEVQVQVFATREGPLQAILNFETNDPNRPTVSLPVRARGVPSGGGEVVKIEMTYDNGQDNFFDNDVRNVDMTLEHPFGYVCNKQTPNPTNWGNFGSATWMAFAPKDEPERIILADAREDGTYRVMINYQADCASVPSDLLAGLLGISVEVLAAYITHVPTVPGQDVGAIVQSVCLNTESSAATIKVYVNGTLVAERNATLGRKGDSAYVLNLIRQNGTFQVQ